MAGWRKKIEFRACLRILSELHQSLLRTSSELLQNSSRAPSELFQSTFRCRSGLFQISVSAFCRSPTDTFRALSEIQFILYDSILNKCKSVTQLRLFYCSRTNCFKCALNHSPRRGQYLVAEPTISKGPRPFDPPRSLSRSRTNSFKGAPDHSPNPDPYLVAVPTVSKAP